MTRASYTTLADVTFPSLDRECVPKDAGKKMPAPVVSIIIDNYNYARFLPRCIESALAQTHANTEVIVVDDASTDDSRDVILRYPKVVPVLKEKNGGQASALNAGFRESRGEIVIFLDSDDYLEPDAASRVVASWKPGTAKLQYRLVLISEEGRKLDLFPPSDIQFDSGDVVPLLLSKGRYHTAVTSGNAFDRKVLDRLLPIPEVEFRISADGYLVTLAPLFGRVISLDEPLGAYRLHGNNAWAIRDNTDGLRFRRALEHDMQRHRVLRGKAGELGLKMEDEPGLQDWLHLESRISSLCLEPELHPIPADRRASLGWKGFWASSRDSRLPWKRRAILTAWFLSVGMLPRSLANRAIAWRLAPVSRPWILTRMLKLLRDVQGTTKDN